MRTQPIDGEALDSWLEATSHRLSSTWADFTEAVGLPDAAGAATACLIQLTLGDCRHQRGHRATSRSTVRD